MKFDDAPVQSYRVVSESELEVVTPLHAAGMVSVSVETTGGIGRSADIFSFVGDQNDPDPEGEDGDTEKERRILGCGNTESAGSSNAANFFLAGFVAFVLTVGARRQKASSN